MYDLLIRFNFDNFRFTVLPFVVLCIRYKDMNYHIGIILYHRFQVQNITF